MSSKRTILSKQKYEASHQANIGFTTTYTCDQWPAVCRGNLQSPSRMAASEKCDAVPPRMAASEKSDAVPPLKLSLSLFPFLDFKLAPIPIKIIRFKIDQSNSIQLSIDFQIPIQNNPKPQSNNTDFDFILTIEYLDVTLFEIR